MKSKIASIVNFVAAIFLICFPPYKPIWFVLGSLNLILGCLFGINIKKSNDMPSEKEWRRVHADLMKKLNLPCKLEFSKHVKVGQHHLRDDGSCCITVNLEADFKVPEHLILHEAAHHCALDIDPYHGHDDVWAGILCDMYRETGTPLPRTTSFIAFARLAGIERRNFAVEGNNHDNDARQNSSVESSG